MPKVNINNLSLFLTVLFILISPLLSYSKITPEEEVNISVYKNTAPSVVNITTTTLIRDFFSVYPRKGAGSGTIINSNGYIMTNYHVIEDASEIKITLSNGEKYNAKFIGAYPENDIAILKIDSKKKNSGL